MFETVFKALGEPTRLIIIRLLAEQDLCVCDLEEIMQISQPRISQHLKVLKQAGLVAERREAQKRICSLDKAAWEQVFKEFNLYMNIPLSEQPQFQELYERLVNLDEDTCAKKRVGKKSCKQV